MVINIVFTVFIHIKKKLKVHENVCKNHYNIKITGKGKNISKVNRGEKSLKLSFAFFR